MKLLGFKELIEENRTATKWNGPNNCVHELMLN